MEVLDKDLFAFSSSTKEAQLVPGGTMQLARGGNVLSVTHAAAKEATFQGQANSAAAAHTEMNQVTANEILCQERNAAEALSPSQAQESIGASVGSAANHGHVKNSIVPFLVGQIAKVLG